MRHLLELRVVPQFVRYRFSTEKVKIANRVKIEKFHAKTYYLRTRLATAAPSVAAEWDYDKNPGISYPLIVCVGSIRPFWWLCSKCGHSYQAAPERRITRGFGCVQCSTSDAANEKERHSSLLLEGERNPNFAVQTPPRGLKSR